MRLSNRGLVDRNTLIRFTFDGRPITAFGGDTVASALLAEGRRMIARSFKYHRPRGLVTAGPDDPSGLVTIGRGEARIPNTRATQQEIYPGLEVFSQNAWPSLDWDLLSINDRFSRFLGAGFYYKTFMWPGKAWEKLYEPLIRRAAGLGALSGAPALEPMEKAFAFCDLLVIGGGPAGLFAALIAGRSGADVLLVDEDSLLGGRLNSESEEIDGAPAQDWLAATIAELASLPNVRLMPRTTLIGSYDGGTYGALERVSRHRHSGNTQTPAECFWRIHAKQALLCTGARERMIAFPGNDRPGVMSAAAVRTYLHRFGAIAGPRIAVFGNNDDAHRTARDLSAAGVQVTALIDTRPDIQPDLGQLRSPFPVFTGAEVFETEGRHGLHTIRVRHGGMVDAIEADCLAVSGGWNPEIGLATHLGAKPVWDADLATYLPPPASAFGAVPGLIPAGAAAGALASGAGFASAKAAALQALAALGTSAKDALLPQTEDQPVRITAFWQVEGAGAFLDLQNDVTTKDVALAAREGFTHAEHMKRYTTQGMAPDQGKISNLPALGVLSALTGRDLPQTGVTSWRPPQVPVAINAFGAGGLGKGFASERILTSHRAALERGAPMLEAGLWYRPAYFPKPGETDWLQSCNREALMVRATIGVCDVSTLGKFEVQGPDAAAFLDLIYTGRMSRLVLGQCRYGLMLREDGFVLDDGICARLGDTHYLLTSTTGAAAEVAAHLEFVRQVYMPKARLRIFDVTEAWAQFALTGPKSGQLLDLLLDVPLPESDLPHMSCLIDTIGGSPVRLLRVSFSGERGYEIAIPARFGAAFWRLLLAQAESLGGGAYGLEALNVLRLEKGYLTHAEIDGRVTADDLGYSNMVAQKDHIGTAMSRRPGLSEPNRLQLVGLEPLAGTDLAGGALLLGEGAAPEGHITSAGYSPTLRRQHGLALLQNGRARLGETIAVIDHLRGTEGTAKVIAPCAYDPSGAKMR